MALEAAAEQGRAHNGTPDLHAIVRDAGQIEQVLGDEQATCLPRKPFAVLAAVDVGLRYLGPSALVRQGRGEAL